MTETNAEKLGYNEPHQYTIDELIELQEKQLQRQKNARVINSLTGEVCRFKTNLDRGTYDDGTIIVNPSETDVSSYEPLETTIERCSRSGYLAEYMKQMQVNSSQNPVDEDVNNFDFEPGYEQTPGLDLSDAKEFETQTLSKQTIQNSKASEGEATSELASANASPSEASGSVE